MRILLIKHGQGEDDVMDAYGGWSDYHMTDEGVKQVNSLVEEIKELNMTFDIILSSPLIRAKETAEILSNKFVLPIEIMEYVKERNTYGLITGINKEDAKKKYPWIVEAFEKGDFVEASEREDDFNRRVQKAFDLVKEKKLENMMIVTHGNFIKGFVEVILKKKCVRKDDAGYLLLEFFGDEHKVLANNRIDLE